MKRRPGHASVEEHPKGSGLYRVRARVGKKRPVLGKGLTLPEAEELADGYAAVRSEQSLREGLTLEAFGEGFKARRRTAGIRAWRTDASSWDKHVADSPLGKLAVSSIIRRDIVEWRDGLTGAYRTRVRNLNLLRVALDEAVERELLTVNPARSVKIHRAAAASSKDDLEGILTPMEQQRLLEAIPSEYWRAVVAFALCTGLRQAEQWWLQWDDVGADSIIVRRSVGGLPPKSGKIREVPLLPAAKAALAALPRSRRSPLVFRTERGAQLADGKPPRGWKDWLKAAGINRKVRWHDLRHTCATSLLAGWWGRKWTLQEIAQMLGHSTISVTEIYARKLQETLHAAVRDTPGLLVPHTRVESVTERNDSYGSPFVKHRSRVQVSQSAPVVATRVLGPSCGHLIRDGQTTIGACQREPGHDGEHMRVYTGWYGPQPPPSSPGDFAGLPQGWD